MNLTLQDYETLHEEGEDGEEGDYAEEEEDDDISGADSNQAEVGH